MDRPAFHTITLGCKLNQFDTAAIEGELARRGYVAAARPERAEIVIVNTCTVTARADADARKLIRGIRRANADCRLLVTGCYAEREPEAIASIEGVDRVFGNRDKPSLATILDALGARPRTLDPGPRRGADPGDRGCDAGLDLPDALHFGDRSRAFLKIQEGCNLACSYCVIPRVRGASRSVPAARVRAAVRSLFDDGFREVVLTGVNTGDWGRDLEPRSDLATLVRELLDLAGPNRIRLNSLEPLTVTDDMIETFVEDPRLAPHLQVPLQSGSEPILRAMRRNYRASRYLERVSRLRARVPHCGIGADVIVGFPGESDACFEETFRFIADSPLNYLHVFAWSPRPGTPASDLERRPAGGVVRDRSRRLRSLADELGARFRRSLLGGRFDAVVLDAREDRTLRALTGNFVEVSLPAGSAVRGDLVDVRIDRIDDAGTHASVAGRPRWADDRTVA
jgi:threonylcarbamoyladenosine tRNA methylthiotransferase MtaB